MGRLGLILFLFMPTHDSPEVHYDDAFHGDIYMFANRGISNAYNSAVIVNAITCLAYDPPATSVHPAESEGAAVNNPTYQFVGFVYEVDPKT